MADDRCALEIEELDPGLAEGIGDVPSARQRAIELRRLAAERDNDDDERRRGLHAADLAAVRALVSSVEIVDDIDDYAAVGGIRREPCCLICAVEGPALDWPPHHHECVVLRVRQQFGITGPLRDDYPPAPGGVLVPGANEAIDAFAASVMPCEPCRCLCHVVGYPHIGPSAADPCCATGRRAIGKEG